MRSTNNPGADGFTWDGTPKNRPAPRALRVAQDSPTRLLRTAQADRCTVCGNRVEWYQRPGGRTVPLHPRELPAADVSPDERWHVNSGLTHPTHDASAWCRVRHHAPCPAAGPPDWLRPGRLDDLRRQLALYTRRLIDTGTITPTPELPPDPAYPAVPAAQPVVQFLYLRYLAPGPLGDIRCVTRTRGRHRCPHPLQNSGALPGTWILQPVHPTGGHLPFPTDCMAVYDLTHLPYTDRLRWRAQRCSAHAAAPAAADIARTDWEPFDPLTHHRHIRHQLPDHPNPVRTVHR
jgi:hypothetical protein